MSISNNEIGEKKDSQLALWRHRQSDAKWRSEVQSLYSALRELLRENGQKQTRACLLSDVETHIKNMEDQIRKLSSAVGLPSGDSFKEEFLDELRREEQLWKQEKKEKKKVCREQQKKLEASLKIRPMLLKEKTKILPPPNSKNKENFFLSLPKNTPQPDSENYIYLEIINAANSGKNPNNNKCEKKSESNTKGIFVPFLKVKNKEPTKSYKRSAVDAKSSIYCKKPSGHHNIETGNHANQSESKATADHLKNGHNSGSVDKMLMACIVKRPKRRRKIPNPQKCLPFEDECSSLGNNSTDCYPQFLKCSERNYSILRNSVPSSKNKRNSQESGSLVKGPHLPVLVDDMLLSPPIPAADKMENIETSFEISDLFENLEASPSYPKEVDYECETSVYNLLQDIMSEK